MGICLSAWQPKTACTSLCPPLSGSLSDGRHMNLNAILFTCELSWRALKAAGFAGSGLDSLAPSPLTPLVPLPPALAGVAGRTAAGPPPAQLLLGHQGTWQTLWGENIKMTLITNTFQMCDNSLQIHNYRYLPIGVWLWLQIRASTSSWLLETVEKQAYY